MWQVKSLLSTVRTLIAVLPPGSGRFILGFAGILSALSLFDIAALGLLAVLLIPMVTGADLSLPVVGQIGPELYPTLLIVICTLIVTKDVAAILIQRASTRRFARFEQALGAQLLDSFFLAPWTERLQRNSTDVVRSTDVGVASTVSGVLVPFTQLAGEIFTFLAVVVVLLVARPVMATVTIVYFLLIGVFLYRWVLKRAVAAGQDNRNYSVQAVRTVSEMVHALKEITLRDKAQEVEEVVLTIREKASTSRADQTFLGSVPRYVMEIALIGGFLLAAGIGWAQGGMPEALASLALFGVSGFRLVPSITRFQTIMGQTGANIPYAERVIAEIESGRRNRSAHTKRLSGADVPTDAREMRLDSVSYTYTGSDTPAVQQVNLTLPFGSSLALVGASGSGKSTLVDIMLGLLDPTEGSLSVDEIPLEDCMRSWQSRVGYVPQQVALFDASIAQNVALSWTPESIDGGRVRRALARAQLLDVVEARPGGISALVGEGGMSLSGGQRQRLGIARALYHEPLVLFMDEATSALDTTTEAAVTDAVRDLAGEVTLVVVAHRLATIRHSDQVCFMRDGRVAAMGTFDEVVAAEPDFAQQASLAGLVATPTDEETR